MDKKEPKRTQEGWRTRLARWLGAWAADFLLVIGMGLVGAGAAMIYPPAGVIAAGVLLIVSGVLWAKGGDGP